MNQTARHKINSHHLGGCIAVGAIFAALMGSPLMFIIVTAALIASSVASGEIRFQPERRR